MKSSTSVCLRDATTDDQSFLELLYAESHRDEFAPLGLEPAQLQSLLQMQCRAQREGYARDYPTAEDWIIVEGDRENGSPVGRMLLHLLPDAIRLVDLALLEQARGRGVGTRLLEDLRLRSAEAGIPIQLQVRRGNRAFELYCRLGFRVVGGDLQLEMKYSPKADVD